MNHKTLEKKVDALSIAFKVTRDFDVRKQIAYEVKKCLRDYLCSGCKYKYRTGGGK